MSSWVVYKNIDMCFQGDVEIIQNWRSHTSISALRKTCEEKQYSAVCVGSFGHAALKRFDYQLTKGHMKASSGYTNEIHVYYPKGNAPRDGTDSSEMHVNNGKAPAKAKTGGTWQQYSNIDMCGQGDVEIIGDWKRKHSIEDLKRMVEEKGYSAVTVSAGKPSFGHAALKRFDFTLTKDHCRPISTCCKHPCTIYIYTPPGDATPYPVATGMTCESCEPLELGKDKASCIFKSVTDSAFDTKGVLYALGTDFGKKAYANPADSGKVSVLWSDDAANYYSTAGGHKVGDSRQAASVICANKHPGANATMWSKGMPGAWFAIDLQSVALRPSHFAYRNDYGGGGNHPRAFELQGSNDGREWATLSKHSGEGWSNKQAKHWPVEAPGANFYRLFRVLNQGSPNHLCCSGIELYGDVKACNGGLGVGKAASVGAKLDLGAPPKEVRVSGAGIWWCNDTWTLAGERHGRPYWRRNGNPTDCLAWVPAQGGWTLSGTPGAGDSDVYVSKGDAPLPPQGGWAPRGGGGSFGATVPSPAPTLAYEAAPAAKAGAAASKKQASADLHLGSTPSHGNPASNSALNTELNNIARNTDDTAKARALVAAGADLASTNGPSWRHTPLHQAAYHGRYEMAKALIELGAPLKLHSNPCGRGAHGTPAELARGGGHGRIADMIEAAIQGGGTSSGGGLLDSIGRMLSGGGGSSQQVVMGTPVDGEHPVDAAIDAKARRPLFEIANGLKRELGLSGNLAEVVHQAAEMLGLEAKGKSLVDLAAECGRHVGV